MNAKLKIGIIGTGSIADDAHAPAISALKNAELSAVLSRSAKSGQTFLDKHSSEGIVYTSINELANSDIDLVIICSPDRLHLEQASKCIEAGKHVLLEKPMTTALDEAQQLGKLVEESQSILGVGFHLRHHSGHQKLRKKVLDGEIGEIRHVRFMWTFYHPDDSNWRAKQDLGKWWSLSAVGSHCLDLARWFMNDFDDWKQFKPVTSNDVWNGPHDETAVISAQLESGTTVSVVSSAVCEPYSRVEILGSKGIAICEETLGRHGEGKIYLNNQILRFEPQNPFLNQLESFIQSAENNRLVEPTAGNQAGLRSVKDLLLADDA